MYNVPSYYEEHSINANCICGNILVIVGVVGPD